MRFEVIHVDNGFVLKTAPTGAGGFMGFGEKEVRKVFLTVESLMEGIKAEVIRG
jgi:hypothetical protein